MNLEIERAAFENMVDRIPRGMEPKESNYNRLKRRKGNRLAYLEIADELLASIPESVSTGVIEKKTPIVKLQVGNRRVNAQVVRKIYHEEDAFDRVTTIQVEVEGNESQNDLFSVEERLETDLIGIKTSFHARRTRIIGQNGPASDHEVYEGMLAIKLLASLLNGNL